MKPMLGASICLEHLASQQTVEQHRIAHRNGMQSLKALLSSQIQDTIQT